jgi:hypothetical protein
MRRQYAHSHVPLIAAGLALMLSACNDVPTGPKSADPTASPIVVGSLPAPPLGATGIDFESGATTEYCGANATVDPSFATVFADAGGNAFDLTAAIAVYNPGWPAPVPTSAWIGAQADANEYTVLPGTRCFEETITIPAGQTGTQLNLTIRADNVAIVYLNGVEIGRHTPTADNPANWNTDLYITDNSNFVAGDNTLTVLLINTLIGYPGNNCALGPPGNAPQSIATGWDVEECRNPSAVSYAGTLYHLDSGLQGCSPGFWQNKAVRAGLYPAPTTTGTVLNTVFDFAGTGFETKGTQTFLQALTTGGGGVHALMRHAVAAYLNALSPDVDYPLTPAQVVDMVNDALDGTLDMESVKDLLDEYNNLHGAAICS